MKNVSTAALIMYFLLKGSMMFAGEKNEQSSDQALVTGAVITPAALPGFTNRTLEISLYQHDPFLADTKSDLIDQFRVDDYAHSEATQTSTPFQLGVGMRIVPRKKYYISTFILQDDKRTHIGEIDGKQGLSKVVVTGDADQITVLIRTVKNR